MSLLVSQSHALFAFGTLSLLVTLVVDQHRNVGLFALLGAFAWGILAHRAGALDLVTETGATTTIVSPEIQLFGLAGTLTSLIVLYGAVITRTENTEVTQ
ncbi:MULTISPECIES: hypothetical protein [Haloferax]|uniref:Uncharacterized protein n=1 Tax=Haloferax mediterranei (strain ATCC 33500 / DSM 1411 / JCM 8866 / NBRC 14739 / NCIMB 2177 / R-4) TaxID=523841 RepID=I3R457_HALMT|nr:hypothetical protein [Haloferax mediterranei]AFK19017.1 hypothetical protein HFX_1305 [Haloferax mediterranei ATCC 33500]MDX5989110.1 hypothetical protein [Haloferax mediterranei ATCC 33500]